jgi:hypothetical protein
MDFNMLRKDLESNKILDKKTKNDDSFLKLTYKHEVPNI